MRFPADLKPMSDAVTLSGLFVYPVKSTRGIAQVSARLTPFGA